MMVKAQVKSVSDKVRNRLEQLDDFEEVSIQFYTCLFFREICTVIGDHFFHSLLHPLLWVANVPCKSLLSAALFIWSYRLEPVQSPRSSTHVRLGLPLPYLPSSFPFIVVSRVS